jgi:hypothetical protein
VLLAESWGRGAGGRARCARLAPLVWLLASLGGCAADGGGLSPEALLRGAGLLRGAPLDEPTVAAGLREALRVGSERRAPILEALAARFSEPIQPLVDRLPAYAGGTSRPGHRPAVPFDPFDQEMSRRRRELRVRMKLRLGVSSLRVRFSNPIVPQRAPSGVNNLLGTHS